MSLHESYQKWIQVGRELGLSDAALNDFVKNEIAQERETRNLDRQMMKIQAQERETEKERERKERETEKEREKEHELKVLQIQMEKEIALKRLEIENDKAEKEAQIRRVEIEARSRVMTERNETENSHFRNFNLGLPKFNNDSAQLHAFLSRFETLAKAYGLPVDLWSLELCKSLDGVALQVFESLSAEHRLDYDALKYALLKRFEITEGTFRKLFLNSKTAPMESQSDFVQRLTGYLRSWLKHSGYDQTYEDLETMMVKNCYFKSQPKPIQIFIKERGQRLTLEQMVTFSESYRDAHGIVPGENESGNKFLSSKNEKSSHKIDKGNLASVNKTTDRNGKSTPAQTKNVEGERDKRKCYGCQSDKHMLKDCPYRNEKASGKSYPNQKNAACSVITPSDQGAKLLENYHSGTVSLPNGDIVPIVAAVKQQEKYLPDLKKPHKGVGYVGDQKVKFVRDTASSITIVRADLVKPEQITDKEVTVMLADGCVKTYPIAEICISTPYYAGRILAACIKTAIHQLLIGNDYLNQEIIEEKQTDGITEYKGPLIFENSNCEKAAEFCDYKSVVKNANVDLVQPARSTRHGKLPSDDRSSFADDLVAVTDKPIETIQSDRCNDDRKNLVTEDDMTKSHEQCEKENRSIENQNKDDLILPENVIKCFHKDECGISEKTMYGNCESQIVKVGMGDRAYEANPCATDQIGSDVITSDFGVRDSAAVQTRSQLERENKAVRPLKLSKFEALNLSVEQFRQLQKEDQNLVKYWQMAKTSKVDLKNEKIRFVIENDVLYREYKIGSNGDIIRQLMIPEPLIDKVICYAHESLLSGHSSLTRTIDNLTQEFYFYSMHSRVKRWVQSCDLCQCGGNRKVGGQAPIMSMPIVKDPFDTVYIDIMKC